MLVGSDIAAEPVGIGALLDGALTAYGPRDALRLGDTDLTYADLAGVADRVASGLVGAGVGPGAVVGLSAGNSVGFVAAVVATARLGATLVMISTSWRELELAHAIELVRPTHLVVDGSGAVPVATVDPTRLAGVPVLQLDDLVAAPVVDAGRSAGRAETDLDAVAVVFFSSGTTGLPKAVRHTHRSMCHAIAHWTEALGLTADDRLQIATPPFHILGLLNVLVVIAAGASMRLHRRFDLDAVLAAIERDRVTIEMAVAPIALAMAAHPDLERYDLSSLRYVMWGATPVTASVAETVTRRTGVRFLPAYGASELPVISCNPVGRPDAWRLDSVGLPPSGVEVRIVDLATGQPVDAGTPGEIQVRSASAMLGYLPEDANDDAFADGWYRTGDVGTIDGEGWITITDRVKEMIKVNGFQVAPAEVEAVLLTDDSVVDCAVFGVPDDATGEAVVAAVVLGAGATTTSADLRALVRGRLAGYKQVSVVRVLDEIPRLPSGKVLRRLLRDQAIAADRADTAQTDAAQTETAQTDTAQTDTAQTETAQSDSARTDSAHTDTTGS